MYSTDRVGETLDIQSDPDVVVIGAGIAGLCAAASLTRSGHQVVVVEADRAGSGTTALAVGIIRGWHHEPVWRRLAARSTAFYDSMFRRDSRPRARKIEVEILERKSGGENGSRFYRLADDESVVRATALRVDPGGTVQALVHLLRRNVAVLEHTPVRELCYDGRLVTGVRTSRGTIGCRWCVVATGSLEQLLPSAVRTLSTAVPVARFAGIVPDGAPVFIDNGPQGVQIAPALGAPGWLVSLPPDACASQPDPGGEAGPVPTGLFTELTRRARFRTGDELDGSFSLTWARYDMTPDGLPLAGWVPELERCLVVAGLGGSGFQVAPALGDIVAGCVDGDAGDPLVRALRPARSAGSWPV